MGYGRIKKYKRKILKSQVQSSYPHFIPNMTFTTWRVKTLGILYVIRISQKRVCLPNSTAIKGYSQISLKITLVCRKEHFITFTQIQHRAENTCLHRLGHTTYQVCLYPFLATGKGYTLLWQQRPHFKNTHPARLAFSDGITLVVRRLIQLASLERHGVIGSIFISSCVRTPVTRPSDFRGTVEDDLEKVKDRVNTNRIQRGTRNKRKGGKEVGRRSHTFM